MGCFSTCFPKSKPPRSLKPRRKAPRLDQLLQRDEALEALELTDIKQDPVESSPPANKDDVPREKLNLSGRKKVTFDPNVKIYEGFAAEEESEEGDFLVKKDEDEKEEEGEEEKKKKKSQCHSDSSSSSSLFSFPPNGYRYQDCRDSDEEFDQLVSDEESDLDSYLSDDDDHHDEEEEEVNNDHLVVKQESSESLFSLSVDSRKHKQLFTETGDKEVNSPMPVKTTGLDEAEAEAEKMQNFDSVLNPVENLSQWKAIKARAKLASQNKAKENKISSQLSNIPHTEEPILKPNSAKPKNSNQEIAVDASLSTWLAVGSEEAAATPPPPPSKSKTSSASVGNSRWSERTSSPKDFEDRPILGALTMEEIKLMSAASTPRKSPIRNPDDMPIIGSVGSYWSHTGQGSTSSNSGSNTRSNFKQGSKVNFNSSMPFEKRLESVL